MARPLRILNETRGVTLAEAATLTETMWERMRGLLGTSELAPGSGLVLDPCNSIHTFFMAYAIDVLFLDGDGRVVRVLERLAPWRLTRIYFQARSVVELPAGSLAGTGTVQGDLILRQPPPEQLQDGSG